MSDGSPGGRESTDRAGTNRGRAGDPTRGADLHEAFDLVANETRFDILRALWDVQKEGTDGVAFSRLREQVGMRDSGQFNYHLDKLVGRFVRNGEDGYRLTHAGRQVVGAAASGVYTEAETTAVEPMVVGECAECGGRLEASYGSGVAEIECLDCELVVTDGLAAPPIIVATHDEADLPDAFSRHLKARVETMNQGFCPLCRGGVDRSLTRFTEHEAAVKSETENDEDGPFEDVLDVLYTCRACGFEAHGVVGTALASEPVVTAFLFDHGIDVSDTLVWEFDWLYDFDAEITSEDPPRVEATLDVDGGRLLLTLDGNLDVREYERV
jgi:hypothetical protein